MSETTDNVKDFFNAVGVVCGVVVELCDAWEDMKESFDNMSESIGETMAKVDGEEVSL